MKTKRNYLLLCLAGMFALLLNTITYAATMSPVGSWTTIDDATNKARSVFVINQSNGLLSGRIIKIYPQPGDTGVCLKCPGNFKNKKILGLTAMWGLKQTGPNTWGGGKILDPKSGQVYSCQITLSSDGKKLSVRGYKGVSLLGRTQTWYRH